MKLRATLFCFVLTLTVADTIAATDEHTPGIRVVSWNVSDDAFETHPTEFGAVLLLARPDILLLDEVSPSADVSKLRSVIKGSIGDADSDWHIDMGMSGGRQRGVIASRSKLATLPEFSTIIPYAEADRLEILRRMSPSERSNSDYSMDGGIPINGAVVLRENRRLLVVVADLQCCGNDESSWQEFRRRVEVRVIRAVIRDVLDRIDVDGIVVAGDFNKVNTPIPLQVLLGPYPLPHAGLIPAEVYHLDGSSSWTWDGRGTPFPSSALDFQLYEPRSLQVLSSVILDSEDLSSEKLQQFGIEKTTSRGLTDHRPVLVEYSWLE